MNKITIFGTKIQIIQAIFELKNSQKLIALSLDFEFSRQKLSVIDQIHDFWRKNSNYPIKHEILKFSKIKIHN